MLKEYHNRAMIVKDNIMELFNLPKIAFQGGAVTR